MDPKTSPQTDTNMRTTTTRDAAVKKNSNSVTGPASQKSLLGSGDAVVRINEEEAGPGAVIITDKQRSRPTIFGAVRDAATEIVTDTTKAVIKPLTPQKPVIPTVTPGKDRAAIVAQAVTNKLDTTSEDPQVVIAHIRTLQKDAERVIGQPFVVHKKNQASEKAGWSHFFGKADTKLTQEKPDLLAQTVTKRTAVAAPQAPTRLETVLRAKEEIVKNAPQAIIDQDRKAAMPPAAPQPPKAPEPAPIPPVAAAPVPPKPAPQVLVPQTPPPMPAPEPIPQPVPEPAPVRAKEIPVPEAPKAKKAPRAPRDFSGLFRTLRIVAIAVVIVVGVGGVGFAAYTYMPPLNITALFNRGEETLNLEPQGFFKTEVVLAVPLGLDRAVLLGSIESAIRTQNDDISELAFVAPGTATVLSWTTDDFFAVIDPRVSSAFIRSLDDQMMIGGVAEGTIEPYMVLKTSNFDTTFAGLLEWEAAMSRDLAPLYGEVQSGAFIDRTLMDRNVRVLYDAGRNAHITYGFLNRNTLIITTTEEAFIAILQAFEQ